MKLGPPWSVKRSAFNEALANGQLLLARRLMFFGNGPDPTTWQLAKLLDSPGVALFLNELQPCDDFLPGSTVPNWLQCQLAHLKAERLSLRWEAVPQGSDKCPRL